MISGAIVPNKRHFVTSRSHIFIEVRRTFLKIRFRSVQIKYPGCIQSEVNLQISLEPPGEILSLLDFGLDNFCWRRNIGANKGLVLPIF